MAEDEDAATIAALWTEAYTARGPEGRQTPNTEADYFEAARSGRTFVAEEDGRLVGVVVFRPASSAARSVAGAGEAELARLAVPAAAQRQGIGRALAELCSELARGEGPQRSPSGAATTRSKATGSTSRLATGACRGATPPTPTAPVSSSSSTSPAP
jgi:predicted N-acetyltransferase YhbS